MEIAIALSGGGYRATAYHLRPSSFIAINSELRDGESVHKRAFQPHINGIIVSGNRFRSSNFLVKHICAIYMKTQYVKGILVGSNNVSEYRISDPEMKLGNIDNVPVKSGKLKEQ